MTLHTFVSASLAPHPVDEIIDIIDHSIPTMWKNKMIEEGFNNTDSTVKEIADFFETRVENLEPMEDKNKASIESKKKKDKASLNKRERGDSHTRECCRV